MIKDWVSKKTGTLLYFLFGLIIGVILCAIGFIGFIMGVLLGIFLSIISSSGLFIFADKCKLGVFKSLNDLKFLNGIALTMIIGTLLLLVFYIFCLFSGSLFFTGIGLSGIVGTIVFQHNW